MNYINRQGGFVKSFVVVGVILVLLTLGVLYLLKQYSVSQPIAPISEGSVKTSQANNGAKSDQSSDEASKNDKKDISSRDKKQVANNDSGSNQAGVNSGVSGTSNYSGSSRYELPTTGPADTLLASSALGAITVAAVAYARSTRLV